MVTISKPVGVADLTSAEAGPATQVDQARTDFAQIEGNLEFIASQLAKVPTRGDFSEDRAWDHLLHRRHHDAVRLDHVALMHP
jgi:hypothetical protein